MANSTANRKPAGSGESGERLWLGFIEPKASWSSGIALLISLCAAVYQLYWFLQGPKVELLEPQQIMFNQADKQRVRMIIPLTFKNESLPRYGEVIVRVDATLHATIAGHEIAVPFAWRNYVRSDPLADQDKGESPLKWEGEVVPLMVSGASAISEDIEFLPSDQVCFSEDCPESRRPHFMYWADLIAAAVDSPTLRVDVVAFGSIKGRYPPVRCTIDVDAAFVPTLYGQLEGQSVERPYHAPPCREAAERFR